MQGFSARLAYRILDAIAPGNGTFGDQFPDAYRKLIDYLEDIAGTIDTELNKELRAAIEPVADWFDIDGEEGLPVSLLEAVADTANMLAEERRETLRLHNMQRSIRAELADPTQGPNETLGKIEILVQVIEP